MLQIFKREDGAVRTDVAGGSFSPRHLAKAAEAWHARKGSDALVWWEKVDVEGGSRARAAFRLDAEAVAKVREALDAEAVRHLFKASVAVCLEAWEGPAGCVTAVVVFDRKTFHFEGSWAGEEACFAWRTPPRSMETLLSVAAVITSQKETA